MTFSLKHGSGLVEAGDAALPELASSRGLQVGRTGLTPKAGSLSATFDAQRVSLEDALQLEETTAPATRLWSGSVFDVQQSIDRGLRAIRYRIRAEGPLRRLINTQPGASVSQMTDLSVDTAITALLDAVGVTAAERDIGPSPRMLTRWWLAADAQPWNVLKQLVTTAGPRARLYEDAMGRIIFRDVALPPTPARTLRGRVAGVAGDALVSRLEKQSAGSERIFNAAEINRSHIPDAAVFIGAVDASFSGGQATMTISLNRSSLEVAGALDGDLLVFYMGTYSFGVRTHRYTYHSGMRNVASPASVSLNNRTLAYRVASSRFEGSGVSVGVTLSPLSGGIQRGYIFAAIYRNAADPYVGQSGPTSTPYPISVQEFSTVLMAGLNWGSTQGSWGIARPGVTAAAADWTDVSPSSSNGVRALQRRFLSAGSPDSVQLLVSNPNPAWFFLVTMRSATVEIQPVRAVVWEHGADIVLAANAAASFRAEADDVYFSAVPPAAAAGDFTATGGAVTGSITTGADDIATVTLTAGATAVTVTGLRLRALSESQAITSSVAAHNAASQQIYRVRPWTGNAWPWLSVSEAQALADEIVAYSAYPRASWELILDGDRDDPTRAACLQSDIGQLVRTNIDSRFNHLGEVVGINHQVSGAATLLQTKLTMLGADAVAPSDNFLYIDSLDNPLYIDALANPLEVR